MSSRHLTNTEVLQYVSRLRQKIEATVPPPYRIFGIPRGGVPVALLLANMPQATVVDSATVANVFVDDIIDSGGTRLLYQVSYPRVPFFALCGKPLWEEYVAAVHTDWIVFPWESTETGSAEDAILRLLQFIGEDAKRGGLVETPKRALKAWKDWTAGYEVDPASVLKTFSDGGESYDEMVLVKELPFYSTCEHHLAPFFGVATIAYVPNGKIVGLSKLSRLLDIFAKRLQVQERLTSQITETLMEELDPLGAACLIKARHLCMESRGIAKQGHTTVTSSLKGCFQDNLSARAEFLALAK